MTSKRKRPTVGHFPRQTPSLSREQVQKLVAVLLRNRPDLVIVRTDSNGEKRQLVEILTKAGAKVIFRK